MTFWEIESMGSDILKRIVLPYYMDDGSERIVISSYILKHSQHKEHFIEIVDSFLRGNSLSETVLHVVLHKLEELRNKGYTSYILGVVNDIEWVVLANKDDKPVIERLRRLAFSDYDDDSLVGNLPPIYSGSYHDFRGISIEKTHRKISHNVHTEEIRKLILKKGEFTVDGISSETGYTPELVEEVVSKMERDGLLDLNPAPETQQSVSFEEALKELLPEEEVEEWKKMADEISIDQHLKSFEDQKKVRLKDIRQWELRKHIAENPRIAFDFFDGKSYHRKIGWTYFDSQTKDVRCRDCNYPANGKPTPGCSSIKHIENYNRVRMNHKERYKRISESKRNKSEF